MFTFKRKTKKKTVELEKCINLIKGFYYDALDNKTFNGDEIITVFLPLVEERQQIRKEREELEEKYHEESDLLDDRMYHLSKKIVQQLDQIQQLK